MSGKPAGTFGSLSTQMMRGREVASAEVEAMGREVVGKSMSRHLL
jgi:hypothetical protein